MRTSPSSLGMRRLLHGGPPAMVLSSDESASDEDSEEIEEDDHGRALGHTRYQLLLDLGDDDAADEPPPVDSSRPAGAAGGMDPALPVARSLVTVAPVGATEPPLAVAP